MQNCKAEVPYQPVPDETDRLATASGIRDRSTSLPIPPPFLLPLSLSLTELQLTLYKNPPKSKKFNEILKIKMVSS